jgi:DNA-directed RNA polymerase specialized sigma subunit
MTTTTKPQKRAKNPDTPEYTSKYYVTNGKMLPEVIKSKETGRISDELAKMLMMLTRRYAQRPCFYNYTYKEDMISEALANLCQNALKFNPEKSSNPFAYYTTCINSSFLQFLNVEKKHRRIRDQLLVEMGENPSFNFQEEARQHENGELGPEFAEIKTNIEEAKLRLEQDAIHAAAKAAAIAAMEEKNLAEEAEGTITTDELDANGFVEGDPDAPDYTNIPAVKSSLLEFDQ